MFLLKEPYLHFTTQSFSKAEISFCFSKPCSNAKNSHAGRGVNSTETLSFRLPPTPWVACRKVNLGRKLVQEVQDQAAPSVENKMKKFSLFCNLRFLWPPGHRQVKTQAHDPQYPAHSFSFAFLFTETERPLRTCPTQNSPCGERQIFLHPTWITVVLCTAVIAAT